MATITNEDLFDRLRIIEQQIENGFYDSDYRRELFDTLETYATGKTYEINPEIMKTVCQYLLTQLNTSESKPNNVNMS